jgi:hypothetical protein
MGREQLLVRSYNVLMTIAIHVRCEQFERRLCVVMSHSVRFLLRLELWVKGGPNYVFPTVN